MPFANFDAFCRGLCDVAGLAAPVLEPDEHGTLAFTVVMRGVEVTALEIAAVRPDVAYLIAEVGPFPQRDAMERCRVLMDANARMVGERCMFSVNRETGQLLLQRAVPFASASASASAMRAYEAVCEMVDATLQWREEVVGLDETWPCIAQRAADADASPRIVENYGVLPPDCELEGLHEALAANFFLMTDEEGASFAREPRSGALVKHCASPMAAVALPRHVDGSMESLSLRA